MLLVLSTGVKQPHLNVHVYCEYDPNDGMQFKLFADVKRLVFVVWSDIVWEGDVAAGREWLIWYIVILS